MSLFTKVKCKYYFQKKVDNKALSKSGRQTQLLRSTETYSRHLLSGIPDSGSSRGTSVVYWIYGFLLFYFRIMQTELAVEQAMMYTARVEAACVSKKFRYRTSCKGATAFSKKRKRRKSSI